MEPSRSFPGAPGSGPGGPQLSTDGRGGSRSLPAGSSSVALLLEEAAAQGPGDTALLVARTGERLTFGELNAWSDRLAHGLRGRGVVAGSRALVLLRPGGELLAVAFALFKVGAIVVFVDPGLGRRHLLRCIADAAPTVLVAIRPVLALRRWLPRTFGTVRLSLSVRPFPGATTLASLLASAPEGAGAFAVPPAQDGTPAVIAFTSGATGTPKGVIFTHGVLRAQVKVLRETWAVDRRSTQLAVLPLLALLGPGLGCATVLPDMDPSRPARADPRRILDALSTHRVTHAFASPTIWTKVALQAREDGRTLPDLSTVLVGGAPVSPGLLEALGGLLPHGQAFSALGATEIITVAYAPGEEVVAASGEASRELGTLVGRPVAGVELRLVRIEDGPIDGGAGPLDVPAGQPGEIAVRGPLLTEGYDARPEADRLARFEDRGVRWYRMGDLGRLDASGRLWFCGRKGERVETREGLLLTACVEPLLAHPAIRALALVGVGERPNQQPVLVVEPRSRWLLAWGPARRRVARELLALARDHPSTRAIQQVLFRRALPVDARHAAKILRGELAAWAARRLR